MAVRVIAGLCLFILTNANFNGTSGVKHIEKRLSKLGNVIDNEGQSRFEDVQNVFDRIDDILTQFNKSVMEGQCQGRRDASAARSRQLVNKLQDIAEWAPMVQRVVTNVDTELKDFKDEIQDLLYDVKLDLKETNTMQAKLLRYARDVVKEENQLMGKSDLDTSGTTRKRQRLNELCVRNKTNSSQTDRRLTSCKEYYEKGFRQSGQYNVYPDGMINPIRVFCDHDTDGGGWTVFQRRTDGSVNFFRRWLDYRNGFGDLDNEFWLGNDRLNTLTSGCCHELRIDMENFDGEKRHATYEVFQVGPAHEQYALNVLGFGGNAKDCLSKHRGSKFTTRDRDNDPYVKNCARRYKGAWWYKSCYYSNLNGEYRGPEKSKKGINWPCWTGYVSLKSTEMKFRYHPS